MIRRMGGREDALRAFAVERGFRGLELIGRGLEFTVYRASDGSGRDMALRIAERRFDTNANDPYVDTRALLVQEYEITRCLAARDFPVAVKSHFSEGLLTPPLIVRRLLRRWAAMGVRLNERPPRPRRPSWPRCWARVATTVFCTWTPERPTSAVRRPAFRRFWTGRTPFAAIQCWSLRVCGSTRGCRKWHRSRRRPSGLRGCA